MGRIERSKLIKRYHTLLTVRKVDNLTKESLLAAYGVESSTGLTEAQLEELCDYIQMNVNLTEEALEMDRWRKSVIRAIGRSLNAEGYMGYGVEYIKAVAVRAAEAESFNKITKQQLVNLYHAFRRKREVTERVMNKQKTDKTQLN